MVASFVYDAVRTPFGRLGRALAGVRPDDLLATTIAAVLERHSEIDPDAIDDVVAGAANQAGEDNRDVARMAVLLAGLPTSVPGVTVNRLCGSGMQAVVDASRAVETGDARLVLAGGVESMSRAPWVLSKPERAFPPSHETLHSTTLGWRLVNPRMPRAWTISLGESNERLAERFGISREQQDAFAARSHVRASAAWDDGMYDAEIVPVPGAELDRDEGIRADASLRSLSGLAPAFSTDGTITAGNASPLNDGASMLIVGADDAPIGADPLARIAGRGTAALDPDEFGIGPVTAVHRALANAGKTWADVDFIELNEAFAAQSLACLTLAQSLACLTLWPEIDDEQVNIHGGAIAIGHPLGASGGRIVGHAAHELARRGRGVAVAAICIGVGQGIAVVLER